MRITCCGLVGEYGGCKCSDCAGSGGELGGDWGGDPPGVLDNGEVPLGRGDFDLDFDRDSDIAATCADPCAGVGVLDLSAGGGVSDLGEATVSEDSLLKERLSLWIQR